MNSISGVQYALSLFFMLNSTKKAKFCLVFCLINLFIYNASAVQITWTGATDNDWSVASNWSPASVPTATNEVVINNVANDPIIYSGTTAETELIYINTNAVLTINSGGILNARGNGSHGIIFTSATIINNGTLNIETAANGPIGIGIYIFGPSSTITNNGTILINATIYGIKGNPSDGTINFTNNSTGTINMLKASGFSLSNTLTYLTNRGIINYTGLSNCISAEGTTTVDNYGEININSSSSGMYLETAVTLTNHICGKIIMNISYTNKGTLNNHGLLQTSGDLENIGTFTNEGIFKYSTLYNTGTLNNNKLRIIDNPTPIFAYGGSYNMTVNGIYVDAAATNSAGTFTPPNSFTPSGLAAGLRTLYAKITPNGGACTYIAPFTYNVVVLPVELLNFKGTNKDNTNVLTWTTATEINNKGFQIERQNPTEDKWDILGFKTANNKASTYQFTDNTPLSVSYYRLRQIDNDGTETLSKIISISNKNKNTLKAYPSVSTGFLTIETSDNVDFQVFNLLGQQTRSGRFETSPTFMDISALPQGTYILKTGTEQIKFIKQ
jgi:hypothetical protein